MRNRMVGPAAYWVCSRIGAARLTWSVLKAALSRALILSEVEGRGRVFKIHAPDLAPVAARAAALRGALIRPGAAGAVGVFWSGLVAGLRPQP